MSKIYAKQMVKQQKIFYYDCDKETENKTSATSLNSTYIKVRNPIKE